MPDPNLLNTTSDGLIALPAGPWSAEKLYYLEGYINIFETSMKDKWRKRNYIDLFAGPGKIRIRNTSEYLLGSPLIALTIRFPFTGYYFVDNDQKHTDALKLRCSASPNRDLVHVYTDDANRVVTSIVSSIQRLTPSSLNLAFLDPFGLELDWNTVSKLGSLKCDLIIYYSQAGISRNIEKAYLSTKETIVDRFFGTDEWRNVYTPWHIKPNKPGKHRELINFYKERLRTLGYQEVKQFEEASSEPLIRNSYLMTPLYRLIFASKHPLGEDFAKKITRIDRYGQKQMF